MLFDGKKLDGRYLLEKQIGSGGFGAVYLATDTRFSGNNQVAIKQISLNSEQATRLFRQEADLLYNLSHPNLPKVTNCFQENNQNFIVMDYISGEDLAESMKKGKRFTVAESMKIADKVLDALEYLHSFLISHRDIKPHNIKIDESGKIFLLDFGTAKGHLETTNPTQFGQSITGFTPFYAPLEQVLRVDPNSFLLLQSLDLPYLEEFLHRKTDQRGDIYSLGATLYHILTGMSPERATATIRAFSIWSGKPDPLPQCSSLNAGITPELEKIIHRSLEIEPDRRFQTAKEMREALKTSQESAGYTPQISNEMTVAISPESNPSFNISNSSIQPTEVFLSHSLKPTFDPKSEPQIVNYDADLKSETNLSATIGAKPLTAPSLIETKNQTIPPSSPTGGNPFVAPAMKQPSSSKKSKLPLLLGALGVFLLLCAGVGGWLALRQWSSPTAKKTETPKVETSKAENNVSVAPAKNTRSLEYFLTVQKMRDDKPFQEPFQSSGQEIFENGYQFQMHFALPDNGYFYVFAEGLNEDGENVISIQFPTPNSNNGSAETVVRKQYQTSASRFEGKPGTEKLWIFWSREKNETAENARAEAFENAGVIGDAGLRDKLKNLLETAAENKTNVSENSVEKITQIEFTNDTAAHLIKLEHR